LAGSIVRYPGTNVGVVRRFLRLKIENEIGPMNPIAEMCRQANNLHSMLPHLKGKEADVMDTFCYFAEAGSVSDLARYMRTVDILDVNAMNRVFLCFIFEFVYF
jgi:hypothetical protein